MGPPLFKSPRWYAAASLKERALAFCYPPSGNASGTTDQGVSFREKKWKEQSPFEQPSIFERRLGVDNLSPRQFSRLLAEPLPTLQKRLGSEPDWLRRVRDAFNTVDQGSGNSSDHDFLLDEESGFLCVIEPLLKDSYTRFRRGIQEVVESFEETPFDPDTIGEHLWNYLPDGLANMVFRSLLLELNAKRLQGELPGATPEARFNSFVEQLRNPEFVENLLIDYPVLVRQVVEKLDRAVESNLMFLEQLCRDYPELCNEFSPEKKPGILCGISADGGDSHQGGRFVRILEFESGLRIVYKPRSLATDVHFKKLLLWLNSHGASPGFQDTKVLDFGDHGWVEFVDQQACVERSSVSRFYERIGGYLAILYVLRATDFHHENIIAHGEHPVLIDLETLFNPLGPPLPDEGEPAEAKRLADYSFGNSVLRVGLLPERYWVDDQTEGLEFSGMGGAPGQLGPHKAQMVVGVGTDNMNMVPTDFELGASKNLPTLNGETVDLLDYRREIVRGFRQIYRLLQEQRDSMLKVGGPIENFSKDSIRVILRGTNIYANLLSGSHHPDFMHDALDRDRFFDQLWIAHEDLDGMEFVFAAERDDLWREDIPYFTTKADSQDLWSSSGKRSINYFGRSGYELVRDQLFALNEKDLERQAWFVEASLNVLVRKHTNVREKFLVPTRVLRNYPPEDFIEESEKIGQRLCSTALRGADDACWIGLQSANEKDWELATLSLDLYDGMLGVALYLAYLGDVTGEDRYTEYSRLAVSTIKKQCKDPATDETFIGAFNGWGSVIYTFTHLGALWNDRSLHSFAEELIDNIPPLIQKDEAIDLLGGAAGAIISLLHFNRVADSPKALKTALACGDHLLDALGQRLPGENIEQSGTSRPLWTGLSHGVSGMAWALFELASVSADDRYRQMGLQAVEFERKTFCPEVGNWPDLREADERPPGAEEEQLTGIEDKISKFECAWCHGAPGIGLARILSFPYLSDATALEEIQVAAATTLREGSYGNHSLCHGDLGNLELFLHAKKVLGDSNPNYDAVPMASRILESIREHGPRCGIPLAVETPGFMTGISGIGYGLLRAAAPDRVPSVLALQPPSDGNYAKR